MSDVIETVTELDPETGHELVTCEVNSRDLKEITADTAETFELGDDSWTEGFFDHLNQTYTGVEDLEYDDYDWRYSHRRWLGYVAEGVINYIICEQPVEMVKQIELVEVESPAQYNFRTDSFYANWTVDLTMLREWWAESGFDFASEMRDGGRHGSYSGFFSAIESRHREDPLRMEVAMMLDRWIESWSSFDHFLGSVFESLTGNGEQDQCIEMVPSTVAGLMAWVQADYIVDDDLIHSFVPVEVDAESLMVGDLVLSKFGTPRRIESIEQRAIPESKGGGVGLYVIAPFYDGSGGAFGWRMTDRVVRAFNPDRDGRNG